MLVRYQDFTGALPEVTIPDGIKSRTGTTITAGPVVLTQIESNLYEAEVSGPVEGEDYRFAFANLPTYTAICTPSQLIPVFAGHYDASLYFETRLHSSLWGDLDTVAQAQYLIEATDLVNSLAFRHDLHRSGQSLEFPRGCVDTIPSDIKYAALEVALSLADGKSVETETAALRVTSRRFAGVATTYAKSDSNPLNVDAGIISISAWRLLQPYLRQTGGVRLYRAS